MRSRAFLQVFLRHSFANMSPKRIRQQNKTVTIYNSKTVNGNNKKDKKCAEQNRNGIDNWNFYFKPNELDEIKSSIKCKDLTGVPLVIGAAVLNKKDILLNLLKQGYNINETDKHNYSALCWAVKLKQLDIVEFLLCNKADPLIKPVNGDDVLNMALGSNAWDEESFIVLFNILKIHGHVDINASNKNYLSVLHLTIRREWNNFFDILLSNEVNINTATPCGVTPLMLASYRHDIGIVNRLIAKGASVTFKNSDGFTALCYAFSSAIIKRLEPPFPVVDKLQIELAKNNIYLLDYLKDKLGTILEPKKVEGDQISIEEMLQYILRFVICNINGGFEVLWNDFGIVSFIKQLLVKRFEDFEQLKFPLLVLNIVAKNISSSYDLYEVVPTFINSGCLDICLEIVKKGIGDEMTILAFYPMFTLFCKFSPESASSWIERKYEYLQSSLSAFIKALKKTEILEEDLKLVLGKVDDFKRIFVRLSAESTPERIMLDSKQISKKNKRRAKAQKAKIAKAKSVDLSQRLTRQFTEEDLIYKENMCVNAIKTSVGICEEKRAPERNWKQVIQELPFRQCPHLKLLEEGSDKLDIDLTIKYLEGLLGLIVNKYKIVWELDRPFECDHENDVLGFTMPIEENVQFQQNIEREKLRIVHKEFYNLTNNIRKYQESDFEVVHALLKELEKLLLAHSIRGETILEEVTAMEVIKINVTMPVDFANVLPKYMEDVVNEVVDEIEEVNINVLEHVTAEKTVEESGMGDYVYFDDSLIIKSCECESPPMNKNDYYHLASSILNICEENDEARTCCNKGCIKGLDVSNNKESRWCSMMRSLEMMDDCQCFFNGKIRISNSEKRKSHILAPSGNFAVLEMGLGSDNEPLAVKFLAKNDVYAPLLKMLIDPIADLRHKNVLHYYICAYDVNYLVIATPLCEYNLGQYVLKMRHSQMKICKVNIIRQMLAGLMFLHDHDEPVVHGNLKPSNVLVDCDGVVRIAEFGIHKAFLNEKNLPESTIIWFASECYKLYRQNALLECTCSSDIQVAGMLVHFAMNHGSHPFGKDVPDILKNLEKASPQIIAKDMELYDLLTWMLLGEPGDRPTIHQVLSHIFFWSDKKKWRYVLACAGLGSKIPLDVEALHGSLDKTAHKENISGNCWMLTAKKHYPQASFVENKDTPSGLLKFIRAVVENNFMLQDDGEKSLNCFILDSFPYFALSLYRMIENTEWSDHRVFMPFHNVVDY